MHQKLNFRLIFVFIALIIFAVIYISNQSFFNNGIRNILEWKQLNISLWAGVFICFILHYISSKDSGDYYSGIVYKQFGIFADSAFAAITYGLAITTSASILKGVYVQQFFGDVVYFNHFESLDIYSMLVVCLFLFGYSIWASCKALLDAILLNNSEKPEPVYD